MKMLFDRWKWIWWNEKIDSGMNFKCKCRLMKLF